MVSKPPIMWLKPAEFIPLRDALYSSDVSLTATERRQYAFERIRIHSLRSKPPDHVSATALLVCAREHHKAPPHRPALNHITSERLDPTMPTIHHLALAASLDRFVNVFCGNSALRKQNIGMSDAAEQLEIPASVVQCRHDNTHHSLPGVTRLMTETRNALDWLWHHYWVLLDQPPKCREQIVLLLREYRSGRRQEIATRGTPCKDVEAIRALDALGKSSAQEELMHEVVCALVEEEKMLIPGKRELGDSMASAYEFWRPVLIGSAKHFTGFAEHLAEQILKVIMEGEVTNKLVEGSDRLEPVDGARRDEKEAIEADQAKAARLRTVDVRTEALCAWLVHLFVDEALWKNSRQKLKYWERVRWQLACVVVLYPDIWAEWLANERALQ